MTRQKVDFYWNGSSKGNFVENEKNTRVGLWKRVQINEWTFSLFLFTFSLAIVVGKLFINYGDALHRSLEGRYTLPSLPDFSQVSNFSNIPRLPSLIEFDKERLAAASERLMNASLRYEVAVADTVVDLSNRFGWFVRATLSGLAMMGFTWFIIYKDSSIPGVNPPSPFSPSKQRIPASSRIQMNYLVGVLNGILIFLYMCL